MNFPGYDRSQAFADEHDLFIAADQLPYRAFAIFDDLRNLPVFQLRSGCLITVLQRQDIISALPGSKTGIV
ncbi:hypothetical protein D3C76_1780610 [compost metagenome]